MTEFSRTDDLREAQFRNVDLTGARFRGCNFSRVRMTDMWLVDVDLDGMINRVTVNGVDVVPFVVAELDRRHPERTLLRADDLDSMRRGWTTLTAIWDETIARTPAPDRAAVRVGRRRMVVRADVAPPRVRDRQVVHAPGAR